MKFFTKSVCISLVLSSFQAQAQDAGILNNFSFSGYADAYVAYYTDSLPVNDYQKFPAVSPRSRQFGLNVASVTAKYSADHVRSTITLHYGDIPRSSWSATFNLIEEANAGIRICSKLWLDGGFFRTHVGTEGWFPKENITSSVAVATFFEPLYEAGFKINYVPNDKLSLNLFFLNGYNLYEDNNKMKSLGVLATYALNDHLSIGYDNYIGDDSPDEDSVKELRFYNNVFLNFENNKIKIVTGVDFAFQGNSKFHQTNTVLSGVFALRYMVKEKFDVYGRAEAYYDRNGLLSGPIFVNGSPLKELQIGGLTLGMEYKPTVNSYIRLEGRDLVTDSSEEIFRWNNKSKNSRLEAMLNFGVWFP